MAVTQNTYTGNGITVLYSFTFPYIEESDIKVEVNGSLTTAYTLANATTIQFNTAPANGAAIKIYRVTDDSTTKATFFPGSAIRSQDLNDNFTQAIYIIQEVVARALNTLGGTMSGILNMGGNKITNLGTPSSGTDASTKDYVDSTIGLAGGYASAASASASAAAASASNSASSASSSSAFATNSANSASASAASASASAASQSAASASQSAAAVSASAASTSASNAATSASNAASSATAAANSATSAASSAASALAAFDSFDDRYLGTKTSDPTLDNDGNSLVAGTLYFNSVLGVMKLYTGTAWVAAYVPGTAGSISFTPYGSLTSNNVQGAIQEVIDESVYKTGNTGSAVLPVGTTAQRDATPATGYVRFNTNLTQFEGYNGTAWGTIGGGAKGGGSDQVFFENDQTITQNYTITAGKNAVTAGPVTVNSGVTVTVPSGSNWVIV